MTDDQPCPNCSAPVPPDADLCPNCGCRLRSETTGAQLWRSCSSVFLGFLALILGLGGSCFLLFGMLSAGDTAALQFTLIFVLIGVALLAGAYALGRLIMRGRS